MSIQTDIARGACGAECTAYFIAAHGRPVICGFCAERIGATAVLTRGLQVATHREKQ